MGLRTVWWIGDTSRIEWEDALQWLRTHVELVVQPDMPSALQQISHTSPPQVLLLAAGRPGTFAHADVARLTAAAPLARCVALLGSWCEGEYRTGTPWPGVLRLYWHQAAARFAAELASRTPMRTWQLPRTASLADRVDESLRRDGGSERRRPLALQAESRQVYEMLADCARATGYEPVPGGPSDQPQVACVAGVWQGDLLRAQAADELAGFVQRLAPSPVVVVLSFPRPQDREVVARCGAAAILGTPWLIADWQALLQSLIARSQSPAQDELRPHDRPYPNSIPA